LNQETARYTVKKTKAQSFGTIICLIYNKFKKFVKSIFSFKHSNPAHWGIIYGNWMPIPRESGRLCWWKLATKIQRTCPASLRFNLWPLYFGL